MLHPASRKVQPTCLKAPENKLMTSAHLLPCLISVSGAVCSGCGRGPRTKVAAENRLYLETGETEDFSGSFSVLQVRLLSL